MAGKKRPTPKTLISFDHDNDATYTFLGCIESANIPGKSKDAVDTICLDSDVDETTASDVTNLKEFVFMLFSDPDDADQGLLDVAFESGESVPWRVLRQFTPNEYQTEFDGWIQDLGDIELVAKGVQKQEVTVRLTSKPVTGQV